MEITHPLVEHKMSLLRDKRTKPKQFRELIQEISTILLIQSTMDLQIQTDSTPVTETPMSKFAASRIAGNLALFPIMRAGLGMVDGMQ